MITEKVDLCTAVSLTMTMGIPTTLENAFMQISNELLITIPPPEAITFSDF